MILHACLPAGRPLLTPPCLLFQVDLKDKWRNLVRKGCIQPHELTEIEVRQWAGRREGMQHLDEGSGAGRGGTAVWSGRRQRGSRGASSKKGCIQQHDITETEVRLQAWTGCSGGPCREGDAGVGVGGSMGGGHGGGVWCTEAAKLCLPSTLFLPRHTCLTHLHCHHGLGRSACPPTGTPRTPPTLSYPPTSAPSKTGQGGGAAARAAGLRRQGR